MGTLGLNPGPLAPHVESLLYILFPFLLIWRFSSCHLIQLAFLYNCPYGASVFCWFGGGGVPSALLAICEPSGSNVVSSGLPPPSTWRASLEPLCTEGDQELLCVEPGPVCPLVLGSHRASR